LLSSEVRHSLTKHENIKNNPSTLSTTTGPTISEQKATSPAGKPPFMDKFPLSLSLILVIEIKNSNAVTNVPCAELCLCT